MARVLVVITPAEGHVNPSLGLVTQLIDSGEEVVYVCVEEYRSRIEQTGALLITYPFPQDAFSHDPVLKPQEYNHPYQFIYMMVGGIIQRIIPEVFRVIGNQKFDYLIFDSLMGWGGTILAEKLGIPAVCLIASFAFVDPLGTGEGMNEQEMDTNTMELYEATMKITRELAQEYQVSIPAMEEIPAHYYSCKEEAVAKAAISSYNYNNILSIVNRLPAEASPLEVMYHFANMQLTKKMLLNLHQLVILSQKNGF